MRVIFKKDKNNIHPPYDTIADMDLNTLPRIGENVNLKNRLYLIKKIITRYDHVNSQIEAVEIFITEHGAYNDPSYKEK